MAAGTCWVAKIHANTVDNPTSITMMPVITPVSMSTLRSCLGESSL